MFNSLDDELTSLARFFLQPTNAIHRQYEALRAYFVDGLPSAEAARRFGYSPGSFRVLCHEFRHDPERAFFLSSRRKQSPEAVKKSDQVRDTIVALRKQNLSIYDIRDALEREDVKISAASISIILKEEGFARLPRRRDEERPGSTRPLQGEVANRRGLDLRPRSLRTKFGGLFLFVPYLAKIPLQTMLAEIGFPGSVMIPADCAMRSLLALKLFGNARHSHVSNYVFDEGLALFSGLNVIPKRSFLTEYSCRIHPSCYPQLMRGWFDAIKLLGLEHGTSFDCDFHTAQIHISENNIEVHFQKRARNPFLLNAGFDQISEPVPWLDNKSIRFTFA
jgi:transposase